MTPSAVAAVTPVTLTPLLGMPEVHPGDDLAEVVVRALAANGIRLADGDVLVVSSKIASKALGLTAAAQDRSDVVLRQSRRVVAERDTPLGVTRVVEAVAGPVMAAAGVDASNTGAADVGSALGLHKSTTSRNIGELERLGLIERVPDLSDARARLLRLTPSGHESVTRSRAGRRGRVAEKLSRWPQQDVRELARLLGRLNDDLS